MSEKLFREFWHTHSRAHIIGDKAPDYPQRFFDAFGYWDPSIYRQASTTNDYRPKWILLPDGDDTAQKYSDVFHHFNVFTSLNYYPAPVAAFLKKLTKAENKLQRMQSIKSLSGAAVAKQEQLVKELNAGLKRTCYVDLGIDVDINAQLPDLDSVFDAASGIHRHLSRRGVPHHVFFSGSKGFHIVVGFRCFGQAPAENNHIINREMIRLMEEETGEMHCDPAIYSSRRQFRLVNSMHPKSGKYKIFLSDADLALGLDRILVIADSPRPFPPQDHSTAEYLSGLYALARTRVDARKKYTVKKTHVLELESARQSLKTERRTPLKISLLRHPPCIRDALTVGIRDTSRGNRNLVTLMLATYFKAIGRKAQETGDMLVEHAVQVLSRFSASNTNAIESSTRSAVNTVFRKDQYSFNCGQARHYGFECNDTCELFGKYRDMATNRKLHKTDHVRSLPETNLLGSIGDIRAAMLERIETYIASASSPPSDFLLIKAPAGSGKTTLTFDLLSRRRNLRACWVGSRLDLFENIPDQFRTRWRRIEGRHGDYTDPKGRFYAANCIQPESAARLRDRRLNVKRLLCAHCVENESCDYNAQFRDSTSNWFIQQSMFLHKAPEFIHGFDVVVFDEDIMQNFTDNFKVTAPDVEFVLELVVTLAQELEYLDNKKASEYFSLCALLRSLRDLLADIPPRAPVTGDALHRRWDIICRDREKIPLKSLIERIGAEQEEVIDDLQIDPSSERLPLNFVSDLIRILRFELFDRDISSNLSRLRLTPKGHKAFDGKQTGENALEIFFKVHAPPIPRPTIALDATGRESVYSMLFNKPFHVFAPALEVKNQVIQIYSTSGSMNALNNQAHLARMLKTLKSFIDEEPCTLVIGKERLKDSISEILPPPSAFTHFFGTRGSNEYRGFKQVIVFGAPGFPPEVILMYASCFYYDRNLRTDARTIPKTYIGTDKAVNVHCFDEPLIQDIYEISREDEIYQSLNRIRPASDSLKRIVLLTNVVLDQLPITELKSIEDVIGRRQAARDERYEIVKSVAGLALDKLGFFSTRWNLKCLLDKDEVRDRATIAYLQELGVYIKIPRMQLLARRTIERYADRFAEDTNLKRFEINFRTTDNHGFVHVFGRDSACLDSAVKFLSGLPQNKVAWFNKPEGDSDRSQKGGVK